MRTLKKFIVFLSYFLNAKWVIKLPKKNKFVLVDGIYNPFLKYLKKKDFTIIHRRGEEINIAILLKCLVKFKFSTLDYFCEFIKCVKPKLILTAFDYHTIFYKLSKKTNTKTLMLQKGKRAKGEKFIREKKLFFPKNSKNIFFVDYILVFTKAVKDFYSRRIGGNYYEIGSFENNFSRPVLSKQKKEIIFISNFSDPNSSASFKTENEDMVAFEIAKLAKKNKIKFNILPRYRKSQSLLDEEKLYYKKMIKDKIQFIEDKKLTSYEILEKYKFIFASYSTIAQECLVKGIKTGFIMIKSKNNPAYNFRFGNFEKLKNDGLFWCASTKLEVKKIIKVFNFVIKTNYNDWVKRTSSYSDKIMKFDYQNKTFNKIISNL